MSRLSHTLIIAVLLTLGLVRPASAMYSGIRTVGDEPAFTRAFVAAYDSASKQMDKSRSATPLIALLGRFARPEEQAELDLSIGVAFNQRTGVVDHAQAVHYLTQALAFQLPEQTSIDILEWRGCSREALKQFDPALHDYFRVLVACSYYDLSGGWPREERSNVPVGLYSVTSVPKHDPERVLRSERNRDYSQYRDAIDRKQFLLLKRYAAVDAVQRIRKAAAMTDHVLHKILWEVTPDKTRYPLIEQWLKGPNNNPFR